MAPGPFADEDFGILQTRAPCAALLSCSSLAHAGIAEGCVLFMVGSRVGDNGDGSAVQNVRVRAVFQAFAQGSASGNLAPGLRSLF